MYATTDNNNVKPNNGRGGGAMRSSAASQARRRKPRKSPQKSRVIPLAPDSEVQVFISSWFPRDASIYAHWDSISETVRTLIRASEPGSTAMAGKHLRALARHTATRHQKGMSISDTKELLSDAALASTLGEQVATDLSENSRRTELSYLRNVRARVLPDVYGQPKELTQLSSSKVAAAYTAEELAALLTWCRSSRHSKASRLHAAILLSVGCGIDGFEMPRILGTDILTTPWGLVVRAPGVGKGTTRPPRIVPIRGSHEKELARFAATVGNAPIIGTTKDLNELLTGTEKTPSVPKFHAGRGRSTWTRELLIAGATVVGLRQGGVSTRGSGPLHELSIDLRIPINEYVQMLRAERAPFNPANEAFHQLCAWSEQ